MAGSFTREVSYGIRTHDLSIGRQSSTPLRHSGMSYDSEELIYKGWVVKECALFCDCGAKKTVQF